jgi:prepilin-type N-terminal cleavage/methylation domain-containing protein
MPGSSVRQLPYCPPVVRRSAPFLPLFLVKRDMLKQRKGFTLIELLIVVVIIGILAAIAIPKFANTKQKAYITAMKSDLRNLVTSEEAYFSDSSSYTSTIGNLKYNSSTGVSTPTVTLGTGTQAGGWTATVSHSQMPSGFKCGVGVNMPNPTVTTAAEGEPACK